VKKYLLSIICLFLLVLGCKKDPVAPTPPVDNIDLHKYPGLPDATQSGLNTMGCLINGKPWVAKAEFAIQPNQAAVVCEYGELRPNISSYDSLLLNLKFRQSINWRDDKARFEIQNYFSIQLKPIREVGTYELKEMYRNKFEYWFDSIGLPFKRYILDTIKPQYFEITKLDTARNIISGIFDLRLVEIDDKTDSLQITNGRFDGLYWQR